MPSQPKQPQKPDKPKRPTDWELESPLDEDITLEELVALPPFKEASDQKGDSHTAATRIPQWLNRRVTYLAEKRGTPYQIHSDVLRDAIYLGLRVLHMRYKGGVDWAVEARMSSAVDTVGLIRRVKGQFDELVKGLEELHADGDDDKAAEGLERYIEAVMELEDTWHREKILTQIRNNRTVKEISDRCSPEVRKLIFKEKK